MSRRSTSGSAVAKLGLLVLWLLFLLVPVAFSRTAQENFRLPKLLLSEGLGLASLLLLSWRLRTVERIDWRAALRRPSVLAMLPLLAVATSGLLTSAHPLHVREGLVSLWIAVACGVGWSFALSSAEHRALLRGMIIPATALSVLAILQFHELFNPFRFEREVGERIGLTSLAGSAFDLAAYLVLPCLSAQVAVFEAKSVGLRWAWGLAGGVCLYAIAASQTLTALAALGLGSIVLWLRLLPRRRSGVALLLIAAIGAALALGVGPLRERLSRKAAALSRGDVNRVLTGRLDGWRAALWMLRQKPLTGVGHGAYRAEFGLAKEALRRQGVRFYRSQHQVHFSNAHSDFLDTLAELGVAGGVALSWGIYLLIRTLRRCSAERSDLALMSAALVVLSILALTNFPFHIALAGYPALLWISWIFATGREVEA